MRKLMITSLILSLICTAFVGCASNNEDNSADNSVNSAESEIIDTTAPTEDTEEKEQDDVSTESSSDEEDASESIGDFDDADIKFNADVEAPLGETVGEEIELTDDVKATLCPIDTDGTFTLKADCITYMDGHRVNVPVITTVHGENVYTKTSVMDIDIETLNLDGTAYFLNSEDKIYTKSDIENPDNNAIGSDVNIDAMQGLDEKAQAAFKINILEHEMTRIEFETNGIQSYVYLEDGMFKYIATIYEQGAGSLMIFDELKQESDDQLLQIPSDFKEVSYDEYIGSLYGDTLGSLFEEDSENIFGYDPNVADSIQ